MRSVRLAHRAAWCLLTATLLAAPTHAWAQAPEYLIIVDVTGIDKGMTDIRIRPAGSTSWGPDRLERNYGTQFRISLPRWSGCLFDMRVTYTDGTSDDERNLDWCKANVFHIWEEGIDDRRGSRTRLIYVMNALDDFPREFYIVPAEATSWGPSYPLNRDWTPTTFTLQGGHCVYHIKIVHKSRRVSYYPNHNACNAQVFSIKGSGLAADPLARAVPAPAAASAPSRPAEHDKQIKDCISGTDPKAVLEQCRLAFIMMAYTAEERPRLYAARGRANFQLKDYAEAIKNLDEAISSNARDAESLHVRAMAQVYQKNYPAALRDLDAAIGLKPAEAKYWQTRSAAQYFSGRFEESERDATEALRLKPGDLGALNERALARRRLGRYRESADDFSEAWQREPTFWWFVLGRGISRLLDGQDQAALVDLDTAVSMQPANADALFARAVARRRTGDFSGSDADLRAARAASPGIEARMAEDGLTMPPIAPLATEPGVPEWSAYNYRGMEHVGRGDLRSALADFEKAVSLDPTAVIPRLNLARTYLDLGDFAAADDAANRTLGRIADEKSQLYAEAWNIRGSAHLLAGDDLPRAELCFRQAHLAYPREPAYLANYAVSIFRQGKGHLAESAVDDLLTLDPESPEGYYLRAFLRRERFDNAGSEADLARARALNPNIEKEMADAGIPLPARRAGG